MTGQSFVNEVQVIVWESKAAGYVNASTIALLFFDQSDVIPVHILRRKLNAILVISLDNEVRARVHNLSIHS